MTGSDVITPGSLSSEAGGNFREVQDQLALEPWWFAGVLIEFVSTFSGTIGKQSWRLAAIASPGPIALVWKRPVALSLYAVGIFLTLCEPPLDSIALTLAPMSIISTCAGLSVAWNVILAPCTLGEQLTVVRVLAAAAIVAGTILMGIFGPHSEVSRTGQQYIEIMGRPMASIYYMLLLSLIGVLAYLTRRYPTRGIYPAMLAGALVGNQFLLKVATELLSCGLLGPESAPGCTSSNPLLDWEFWAIATAALTISVGGLTILSLTLRDAEALDIIPVYQGTVIVIGAVSGALVLQEQMTNSLAGVLLYVMSLLLVVVALVMLATRERADPDSLRVPDRVLEWPWYDRAAADMRRRIDDLVGPGLPTEAAEGMAEGKPTAPNEASGLLKPK